jgi:hypothetical protein
VVLADDTDDADRFCAGEGGERDERFHAARRATRRCVRCK